MLSILSGKFKNQKIEVPPSGTRPTSSITKKALFDSIRPRIDASIFCDLFAGSGAVGLEALSQGAQSVYFSESSHRAFFILKKNVEKLKCQKECLLFPMPAIRFLKTQKELLSTIDFFYLDPPYDIRKEDPSSYESLLTFFAQTPLKEGSTLILESSDPTRIKNALEGLPSFSLVQNKKYGDSYLFYIEKP